MRRIAVLTFVLFGALLPARTPVSARAPGGDQSSLRVSQAVTLCRNRTSSQDHVWLRGWFVPAREGNGYVEGGLFDSQRALPLVTINQWDVDGNWRVYGAIYVYIHTSASFGRRLLTLHGRLECASWRLVADRDPFSRAPLQTVYGTSSHKLMGPVSTWATAGGLKLTLTVPQQVYPRDALVRVNVSVKNLSRHTVEYWLPGVSLPGVASPQVQVLDRSGKVVFPPAMPYMPALPGPAPSLVPLISGQSFSQIEYIVVRGASIRASLSFETDPRLNMSRPPRTLLTRSISVRLTAEPRPTMVLHQTSTGPTLVVQRPLGIRGSMLYLGYAECGSLESNTYTFGWVTSGQHLTPGCSPVLIWHVRVAWLNHPVAAMDYGAPQPAPPPATAPAPTPAPSATPAPGGTHFERLLSQAALAMASVRTMHTSGVRTSVDSSARLYVGFQSDCRSGRSPTASVTVRTSTAGRYVEQGLLTRRIDDAYILDGPVLGPRTTALRAWQESPVSRGPRVAIDVHRDDAWDGMSTDPAFSLDPAYLAQVCPALLRAIYLAAPFPNAYWKSTVIGQEVLNGLSVWHLREQQYFKLDLYVDAASLRLRRLVLWDGSHRATAHWRVQFDFSRFNQPIHVGLPGRDPAIGEKLFSGSGS